MFANIQIQIAVITCLASLQAVSAFGQDNHPSTVEKEKSTIVATKQDSFQRVFHSSPENARISAVLNEIIAYNANGMSLGETLARISEMKSIDIKIEPYFCSNLDRLVNQKQVSLSTDGIKLKNFLALLAYEVDMDYGVEDGEIVFYTSRFSEKERVLTRVYEISDLSAGETGYADKLKSTLLESTGPKDYWRATNRASVSAMDDCLIVRASDDVHREVERLVQMLLEHRQQKIRMQDKGLFDSN